MVHLALWKKKVPLRITAARLVTSKQAAKKNSSVPSWKNVYLQQWCSCLESAQHPWPTLVFDLRRRALYWNHSAWAPCLGMLAMARVMLDFLICSCTTIALGCLMGMTTLENTSKIKTEKLELESGRGGEDDTKPGYCWWKKSCTSW